MVFYKLGQGARTLVSYRTMRLCNIKLSGFKSFVDPTNLIVPSSLVGIVGPNGCGKSNIIDAVTWVMGESSAKHLRGESLTDVIFSGSSARQPVGMASVELVFDNTENKIGGQYASYNEISIKRQINRDSVSTYYLNGTRCRRRDITAIFLGTGLGPRSYAIIEQGMISRLIEAKPEELRVFIEEAAGISKYRERRRETENRIKHTKENLDRLNDLRSELEKQLNHLDRQAKGAERYKKLKNEYRRLNSELLALNWRDLNQEINHLKNNAADKENAVESVVTKVRSKEAAIESLRDNLSVANENFNVMQSNFYQVGSDISQHEQSLKHEREKITNTEVELVKARGTYDEIQKQQELDQAEYEELHKELTKLEPELNDHRNNSKKAHELFVTKQNDVKKYRDKTKELLSELDALRQDFQRLNGQLSSLETLRSSVLDEDQELNEWLKENNLDKNSRLSQLIKIDSKWRSALETVLSTRLHHRCVDSVENYLDKLEDAPGSFGLINSSKTENLPLTKSEKYPRLLDQIKTNVRTPFFLENIFIANSLRDASKILPRLSGEQSVVTRQGVWLNKDWVVVNNIVDENESILYREEEIERLKKEIDESSSEIRSLESELAKTEDNLEESELILNEHQSQLTKQQDNISALREILASKSSRRSSFKEVIERNNVQLNNLKQHISGFEQGLSDTKTPIKDIQIKIDKLLKSKIHAENKLKDARTSVESIEFKIRDSEQERHKYEQKLEGLRNNLEKARLDVNSCQVKIETVEEQLSQLKESAKNLLKSIEEAANQNDWKNKLESVDRKIQRLGPINLAAIDEYNTNSERKTYLDNQYKDLVDALNTLENAIRKIDRESRTRFKETFDELNQNIKDMFPKLFGGGHAYLQLTGDELLSTGVSIMAQPPGKKNTNIHLLSGGEKALTAVALVFAIFKLNPAPFCILDEVDAPLDDHNVGRFCNLVKSMSNDVQFVFITHNKITMEIANQLLGVTMHEAGVSRLVSVDVDEAVEMAATA